MRGNGVRLLFALVGLLLAISPGLSQAQQYVYTNDNVYNGNGNTLNSTTALSVNRKGSIKVVATYSTGGYSSGGGDFAQTQVAYAKTASNSCIFASNGGNSNIAAFTINLTNGKLKKVKGSPFSYGVSGDQQYGIGLTTGNGKMLFAANTAYSSISAIKINPDCSLKKLKSYTVSGTPDGMKVTPNGKFLLVGLLGSVDSFAINYNKGTLKDLGAVAGQGAPAGVEISCDNKTAYFGDAATNMQVEVYSISSAGKLSEINNFTDSNGQNSNNVLLSADGKKLYVANTMSAGISTLTVGSGGALTYDSTVKLNGALEWALGLAMAENGTDIFVSETNNPETVGVVVPKGKGVKEVPGSPFSVINNGEDPTSLVAVPPHSCK